MSQTTLSETKTYLYLVHIADYCDARHLSCSILSEHEQARGARYLREEDRINHLVAHSLKRLVLAEMLHSAPKSLQFSLNPFGKPELEPVNIIHFNISHTSNMVAFACSMNPVGVDVESIERAKYDEQVAGLIFSESENSALLRAKNRDYALLSYWTAKEATVKMLGQGLRMELKAINPGKDNVITPGGVYPLYQFSPTGEHVLSVVSDGTELPDEFVEIFYVTLSQLAAAIDGRGHILN